MQYLKRFWPVLLATVLIAFLFFLSDYKSELYSLVKGYFPVLIIFAALLDSVNPCAFSVLFLTIAFLFSLGKERRDILKIGGVYIFGIFTVYVLIGIGVLKVLDVFSIPNIVSKIGAWVLVLFVAIDTVGVFFPKFPIKMQIPKFINPKIATFIHKASIPSALFLGVLVGLFEFPCTGGPYLLILGLLHDHSTLVTGGLYLLLYNLVFVAPLIVVLYASSSRGVLESLDNMRKEGTKKSRLVFNLILLFIAFIILIL